jgi:uncharacterized membrane protein YsdA (DUF1294 family)/cold shock CspA family protein
MRLKGTIAEWRDDRGFGFIEPVGGGDRVFCHVKAFVVRVRRPQPGDGVTYIARKDAQGRIQAAEVRPVGLEQAAYNANVRSRSARSARKPEKRRASSGVGAYVFIAIFATALVVLVVRALIPPFVPLIYLVVSGLAIFAYAFDKSAAMNARWRTQEQTLHVLELFGGWPGALLAQQWFRHKTSKTSFRVAFWFCVVLNVAGLGVYAGQSLNFASWFAR